MQVFCVTIEKCLVILFITCVSDVTIAAEQEIYVWFANKIKSLMMQWWSQDNEDDTSIDKLVPSDRQCLVFLYKKRIEAPFFIRLPVCQQAVYQEPCLNFIIILKLLS